MWGVRIFYNVEANHSQCQVQTSYTVGGVKFLDKIESLIVLWSKSQLRVENETCDSWGQKIQSKVTNETFGGC